MDFGSLIEVIVAWIWHMLESPVTFPVLIFFLALVEHSLLRKQGYRRLKWVALALSILMIPFIIFAYVLGYAFGITLPNGLVIPMPPFLAAAWVIFLIIASIRDKTLLSFGILMVTILMILASIASIQGANPHSLLQASF